MLVCSGKALAWSVSVLVLVWICGVQGLRHTLNLGDWHCSGFRCEQSGDHHGDSPSVLVSHRKRNSDGPTRTFSVSGSFMYSVQVYVKILRDVPGKMGQNFGIGINYERRRSYQTVAQHPLARADQGWILLQGSFKIAGRARGQARMKVWGPNPNVKFLVSGASIRHIWYGSGWKTATDTVIHHVRQSDIILNVTTTGNIDHNAVQIQVVQKSKAFPIGTVVNSWNYRDKWRYRDFIHHHFNWAVLESALKWQHIESRQGHYSFSLPLKILKSLRKQGLKIRGHTLIWSVDGMVQDWVQKLKGEELRAAVQHHINNTMNRTRGLLEHWDVNNENLHGQWFQKSLQDFSFEETPFRIAHSVDPHVKLFLNDFNIVAHGTSTGAYIEQAKRLQKANVGLYGLGVQCHFWNEEAPNPYLIKDRLDKLAQTGLPVWVTEFNVVAKNENRRAAFLETAMRAFYGHPAVEGILIWGFWDKSHSRGSHAALAKGDTMELTEAGRRFLDLWESQWMTDETQVLSESGSPVTVRGFHGDYEVHVRYHGKELSSLQQNFTLGKHAQAVHVNVHL